MSRGESTTKLEDEKSKTSIQISIYILGIFAYKI